MSHYFYSLSDPGRKAGAVGTEGQAGQAGQAEVGPLSPVHTVRAGLPDAAVVLGGSGGIGGAAVRRLSASMIVIATVRNGSSVSASLWSFVILVFAFFVLRLLPHCPVVCRVRRSSCPLSQTSKSCRTWTLPTRTWTLGL